MSRLYLVDDHLLVREGLRAVLQAAGHQVLGESADPQTALGDIVRLQPDVLLLDLSLGERSGFELLTLLRKREQAPRTIVLTMSAQPRHVAEALQLGAAGYVLKGSPSKVLLEAIDTVAAGRRYLGAEVADIAVQVLAGEVSTDPLAELSPRERQIVSMVVRGQSSAAIGQQLNLSPKSVDTYRSRLMAKLKVRDMPALVRWAIRAGLLDADE